MKVLRSKLGFQEGMSNSETLIQEVEKQGPLYDLVSYSDPPTKEGVRTTYIWLYFIRSSHSNLDTVIVEYKVMGIT